MGNKAIHAKVVLGHNETIDSALKKFNIEVSKSGIMQEIKDRSEYLKPSKRKRLERLRNKFKKED